MRNRAIACAKGALLLFVLLGCSRQEEFKSETLTFGSHLSGLPVTGIVQSLAAEFERESGIKIDFQISPDSQWRSIIQSRLESGDAPDIFCADTPVNLVSSLHVENYCVPLTDEEWVSRMDENVVPAVSAAGDVYGITFSGKKMYFFIYNKALFEKAGATVPTNYNELKDTCQKLKAIGVTPMFEGTRNGWHQVLPLFETGGLYLEKDPQLYEKLNANEVDLDEIPELIEIIREIKECWDLGFFTEDATSRTVEEAKEAFYFGQCAMFVGEIAWIHEVKSSFAEFDESTAGIFVMPWGGNQVVGVNPASNALFISKRSAHIEEAKEFFAFLARKENLQKRLEGEPRLSELCWPQIHGGYSDEVLEFLDGLPKAPVVQIAVNYIDNQWMDIGKDIENMFKGTLTPDDVLALMMERRRNQAVSGGDPGWTSQ